jgi:hypothetical protein
MWHPPQEAREAKEVLTGMRPGNSLGFIAFLSALCLLWPSSAHAYLDPGTGSWVVQILIAMLVSIGIVLKRFWSQLTSFYSRLFSGQAQKNPQEK